MTCNCRFLSKKDLEIISNHPGVRAHLSTNGQMYLTIADTFRNSLSGNLDFTTFDLIRSTADFILLKSGDTQLHSLKDSGFSPEGLSALFARFCWVYPDLDKATLAEIDLKM